MSLPGGKKTKTGYSTAADVLEKLAPEYPVVRKVLDYRQVAKLKSTYADGLGALYPGGRHESIGTFNQTITATGRYQQYRAEPAEHSGAYGAGTARSGRCLYRARAVCWWTRIIPRLSCVFWRICPDDKNLIQAYRQAEDIHAITASQVFHVPLEEVTPQLQRRNAKAVNFGIVYGISAFGLGRRSRVFPARKRPSTLSATLKPTRMSNVSWTVW